VCCFFKCVSGISLSEKFYSDLSVLGSGLNTGDSSPVFSDCTRKSSNNVLHLTISFLLTSFWFEYLQSSAHLCPMQVKTVVKLRYRDVYTNEGYGFMIERENMFCLRLRQHTLHRPKIQLTNNTMDNVRISRKKQWRTKLSVKSLWENCICNRFIITCCFW
jgi:hypothetical protein